LALPSPREGGTALVTGASAGIGAALARELAGRGHGVTLVARREERLRELAAELSEGQGVRAEALGCDLESQEERDRLAGELERLGLEVDVLVNNAGFGHTGDLAGADRERQVAMVELNCVAVVDLTARHLPGMLRRGEGAVINVASTAAFQPMPKTATYGATKAFVLSFSEAVHSELKGSDVTVTAVCPGPVKTEFPQVAGVEGSEEKLPDLFWMSPEQVARATVEAAEAGKRSIVPGKINRAGSVFGRHTPRALALPITKRIWGRTE
jgi:short-subunit dehydrogenase